MYYKSGMQTLVVRIPDDLARELEAESEKSNLTKSEVARRRLIAAGPPEKVARSKKSYTGQFLARVLRRAKKP